MVSIVIPKNSLVDIINAGLTKRFYKEQDRDSKIYLINKEKKEEFWKNIEKYVDESDNSLLILNYPIASEKILKRIKLYPHKYSILYIPSKFLDITLKSRKLLLERGIFFMPTREAYKCFPGEYTSETEKKWMEIGELVSSDNEGVGINEKTNQTIFELLKTAKKDPYLAIDKIANDEL